MTFILWGRTERSREQKQWFLQPDWSWTFQRGLSCASRFVLLCSYFRKQCFLILHLNQNLKRKRWFCDGGCFNVVSCAANILTKVLLNTVCKVNSDSGHETEIWLVRVLVCASAHTGQRSLVYPLVMFWGAHSCLTNNKYLPEDQLFIFFKGGNKSWEKCRDVKSEVRDLISQ